LAVGLFGPFGGFQAWELDRGDPCEGSLIDRAGSRGGDFELFEVEGDAAGRRELILEQVDEAECVANVGADQGLLGASGGELEPEVFLGAAAKLTSDEADGAQGSGVPPVQSVGVGPVLRKLVGDAGLPEGDERSRSDDLGLVAGEPQDLDVPVDRLIERHTRRKDGNEIERLLRVRIEPGLRGGGNSELEPAAPVGSESLKPEWKRRLHRSVV
jgi:hypothetical protein